MTDVIEGRLVSQRYPTSNFVLGEHVVTYDDGTNSRFQVRLRWACCYIIYLRES